MRRTRFAVKTNPARLKLFALIKNKSENDNQMLVYNIHNIDNLPTAFAEKKKNDFNLTMYDQFQTQTALAFSAILQNLKKDARIETVLLTKMHKLLQQQNSTSSSCECKEDSDIEKVYFDMRHYFDKTMDEPTNIFQICSGSNERGFDNTSSIQLGNASLQLLSHTLHTQFPVLLAEACTCTQQIKLLAISKNDPNTKEAAHFVLKNNSLVALHYPQTAKKCFEPLGYRSCYWKNREQMKKIHKLMCKDVLLQNVDDILVNYSEGFSIASHNYDNTLQNNLLQKSWSVFA